VRAEDIDIRKGNQLFAILEKMDERSRQIDRLWESELTRETLDKKTLDALRHRNELWLSRMSRVNVLIDKCLH
jgi:hypothetical protein